MRVEPITTDEQFVDAMALRMEVFVGEQGVSEEGERDALDTDPSTLHCVAYDDAGACVGTGRLLAPTEHDGERGNPHIGRVAVSGRTRAGGVGRAVMEFLEAAALERYGRDGAVRVELSAQDQAAGFYQRLGYTIHGDRYLDEGIWHHDAYKDIRAE